MNDIINTQVLETQFWYKNIFSRGHYCGSNIAYSGQPKVQTFLYQVKVLITGIRSIITSIMVPPEK